MKILFGHKYFHQVGGAETYFFTLAKTLKSHHHQVIYFSQKDSKNYSTKWEKYFVSFHNFHDFQPYNAVKSLFRLISSHESSQKISQLLQTVHPDVAHLQNVYRHLSPSILKYLHAQHIPIIYTVHDYHLISANVNQIPGWHPEFLLPQLAWHYHHLVNPYDKYINYYIVPSLFTQNQLIKAGLPKNKLIHLPNCVDFPHGSQTTSQDFVLYSGRLTRHKGVLQLVEAAKSLPHIPFVIAGDGPLSPLLSHVSHQFPHITFIKSPSQKDVFKLISRALCLVIPSLWPENQPYSILESYVRHKPVIASSVGGIPEIVNQRTGLLVDPEQVPQLVSAIENLWSHKIQAKKMGENAYKYALANFQPESYYRKLLQIYQLAIRQTSPT